jgi:VanZ family protein
MKVIRIGLPLMFWIPLVFATYMAWTPRVHLDMASNHDKCTHLLAFGYLTGAFSMVYFRWTTWRRTAGIMIAYGGLIEVVQALLPYRSCSWLDLMADSVGISLALSGMYVINKAAGLLKQRVHPL